MNKILVGKSVDGTRFPEMPRLTVSSLKDIGLLLSLQIGIPSSKNSKTKLFATSTSKAGTSSRMKNG